MPQSHHIDVARRIVVSRAWGGLSTVDFLAHFQAVGADPPFDPTFAQLVDLRDVTVFTLDTGTIREKAAKSLFKPGVPRAIVAPSDIAFGLARMFSMYAASASQTVAVVRTIDEAERWLGVGSSPVRANSTSREYPLSWRADEESRSR